MLYFPHLWQKRRAHLIRMCIQWQGDEPMAQQTEWAIWRTGQGAGKRGENEFVSNTERRDLVGTLFRNQRTFCKLVCEPFAVTFILSFLFFLEI